MYFLWNVFKCVFFNESLILYFEETITIKNFVKWIVLNESPFATHLWYLSAILYVLLLAILIRNFINDNSKIKSMLYITTSCLLLTDLAFGKYSVMLWGVEFPYLLVRNFLFVGIPYFSIGIMLNDYYRNHRNPRIILYLMLSICFIFTTLIERVILVNLDANTTRDHYVSTTFLAISVFLFFLYFFEDEKQLKIEQFFMNVGKRYSTWVYILHPISIAILEKCTSSIGVSKVYKLFAPILVFILTLLLIHCIFKMVQTLRYKKVPAKVKA